jgi:hypothetical protein
MQKERLILHASAMMCSMFVRACAVSGVMPPGVTVPAGDRPIWPATCTSESPAELVVMIACEYGPMAAGAPSVAITVMVYLPMAAGTTAQSRVLNSMVDKA